MGRDSNNPAEFPGYAGEEDASPPGEQPPIRTVGQSAEANRGQRAPRHGSGVVIGSGASDGGGGNDEDFDDDAASGSQRLGTPPGRPNAQ